MYHLNILHMTIIEPSSRVRIYTAGGIVSEWRTAQVLSDSLS